MFQFQDQLKADFWITGRRKEQYSGSIILKTLIASIWKKKFHFLHHFSVDRVSFTGSLNYHAVSTCVIRTSMRRTKYCSKVVILLSIPAHQQGNGKLLDALNVRNILQKTTNNVHGRPSCLSIVWSFVFDQRSLLSPLVWFILCLRDPTTYW